MGIWDIFRFLGICLIPIAVTVLIHVFIKYIEKYYSKNEDKIPRYLKSEKVRYWVKQVSIGLILGGFSIVSYFLGVNVKNYLVPDETFVVGISTYFIVMSGFIFGWPSALVTTFVATLFRICMPSFLRWPTVVACIVGGLLTAFASSWVLKNKRAKWYYIIFGGIFVESLNILFLFLFNLTHIIDAFKTIKQFDVICVLGNGISSSIAALIIQIINKEHIKISVRKDNRIATRLQAILFTICFVGLILTTYSTYVVAYADSFDSSENILYNCAYDIHKDFRTMRYRESPYYCPDRHIVSDEGYTLTIAAEDGIEMSITSESSKDIFNNNQIVGCPEVVSKKLGIYSTDIFKFDDGTTLDQLDNNLFNQFGDHFSKSKIVSFEKNIKNNRSLVSVSKEYFSFGANPVAYYSVSVIPFSEISIAANMSARLIINLYSILFISLFAILNTIINRRIIDNIKLMDASLEKIMDGDLEEEVKLKGEYREFTTLSNNVNLAVGALKNYAQEVEHKMEIELKVARDIQISALPTAFPIEKEYNLHAIMNAAKEVGGDFYDYIKMSNGRILIINADVSGKGVPAAMFMMRAKTLFKSLSSTLTDLSEIVSKANNELCEDNDSGMFVTAWVGLFNPKTGKLHYVNAGHTIPLIKRQGKFIKFENKHRIALAAIPNVKYEDETTYLEPGDELILYTDGVTEANNAKGEMYGIDRLLDVANNSNYFNAKQLLTTISDDVAKFASGVEQFDDITMLMLRYTGDVKEENPENTLTLIAKPISTTVAINYVESVLASRELNQRFIARISIVIDELFANVAFYAYPKGKEGDVTVTVDTRSDLLKIKLIDSGIPFDPTAKEEPDVTASIDDRKRGGLGIFIVKNTMDNVKYEYKNYQNILYLEKKITEQDKIIKKADEIKKED